MNSQHSRACGVTHPDNPGGYCYCNLAIGHTGPHYSAHSHTEWNNDDD